MKNNVSGRLEAYDETTNGNLSWDLSGSKGITPDDIFQLIANAPDKEERDFWTVIGNYLLQKKRWQSPDNDPLH